MSDGKCPNCGASPTDGLGAVDCGSQLSINGATVLAQSEFCRGRADAIRELTEWKTGEPPEWVDSIIAEKKNGVYDVVWRGYHGQWQWYEWVGGDCFEIHSSDTLPDFAKKWREIPQ